ncbi:regulator, partial [Vibrio anguillarum]|nr:regulator [Vibrio anguillarum]
MKYHEMTKNYVFREFECHLSKEETAKLCFKSVRTVNEWDGGKNIPKE